MSALAEPEAAVVRAKVDARRRPSPIWAIPVVSVLIAFFANPVFHDMVTDAFGV